LEQPTGTPTEAGTHECPQEHAIAYPLKLDNMAEHLNSQ